MYPVSCGVQLRDDSARWKVLRVAGGTVVWHGQWWGALQITHEGQTDQGGSSCSCSCSMLGSLCLWRAKDSLTIIPVVDSYVPVARCLEASRKEMVYMEMSLGLELGGRYQTTTWRLRHLL